MEHTKGNDTINFITGNYKISARQNPKTDDWDLIRDNKYILGSIKSKVVATHIIRRYNSHDGFVEALNKLARLGNEPHLGNSDGNIIAQKALANAEVKQ